MLTTPSRHVAIFLASIISLIFPTSGHSLDRDRTLAQLHYTFWSEKDGAPSEISALAQTEDGFLWIGSERGLFRFDGVKFEEFKPQAGVDCPRTVSIRSWPPQMGDYGSPSRQMGLDS